MVQQIDPRTLARRLANGHSICLIDVRQPWESALAVLPGSLAIPLNELSQRLGEIPHAPETAVVIYCHHGIRSASGAAFLEKLGFTNVLSLSGGIDAWSCEVDPTLPRY